MNHKYIDPKLNELDALTYHKFLGLSLPLKNLFWGRFNAEKLLAAQSTDPKVSLLICATAYELEPESYLLEPGEIVDLIGLNCEVVESPYGATLTPQISESAWGVSSLTLHTDGLETIIVRAEFPVRDSTVDAGAILRVFQALNLKGRKEHFALSAWLVNAERLGIENVAKHPSQATTYQADSPILLVCHEGRTTLDAGSVRKAGSHFVNSISIA